MRNEDILEIDLDDDFGYWSEKQCTAIAELVKNLELPLDEAIKWLKGHKVKKIILRNGKLKSIKEEEREEYKQKSKPHLKLIANSWYLEHVELQGVPMNRRFLKNLIQAISELGKTKKIKLSFGI